MIRLGGKARGGKVPRKRGGRALRARQHCHGILLCRERTQVVGQRAHLAAPGRQAVGLGVDGIRQFQVRDGAGKIFTHHGMPLLRLVQQIRGVLVETVQPGGQHTLFQQALERLSEAEFHAFGGLAHGAWLVEEHDGRVEIFKDRRRLFVPQRQIFVHGGGHRTRVQRLEVAVHGVGQSFRIGGLCLGKRRAQQPCGGLGVSEQHFPGRGKINFFHRPFPPLGNKVKAVDAVHLVAPKL